MIRYKGFRRRSFHQALSYKANGADSKTKICSNFVRSITIRNMPCLRRPKQSTIYVYFFLSHTLEGHWRSKKLVSQLIAIVKSTNPNKTSSWIPFNFCGPILELSTNLFVLIPLFPNQRKYYLRLILIPVFVVAMALDSPVGHSYCSVYGRTSISIRFAIKCTHPLFDLTVLNELCVWKRFLFLRGGSRREQFRIEIK